MLPCYSNFWQRPRRPKERHERCQVPLNKIPGHLQDMLSDVKLLQPSVAPQHRLSMQGLIKDDVEDFSERIISASCLPSLRGPRVRRKGLEQNHQGAFLVALELGTEGSRCLTYLKGCGERLELSHLTPRLTGLHYNGWYVSSEQSRVWGGLCVIDIDLLKGLLPIGQGDPNSWCTAGWE